MSEIVPGLIVDTFPVGWLRCNCTILGDPVTKECIVIDPGDETDRILQRVTGHGLTVKVALHTHAHLDHILGTRALKEATGCSIALSREDLWLYDNLAMQSAWLASMIPLEPETLGLGPQAPLPVDHFLEDGEEFGVAGVSGTIILTPGHTPGSLCYHLPRLSTPLVFTGDTLFDGGVGRTDLWGGSSQELLSSIHGKLLTLDDETVVHTGHGSATTIGKERRTNPFLSG